MQSRHDFLSRGWGTEEILGGDERSSERAKRFIRSKYKTLQEVLDVSGKVSFKGSGDVDD